MVVPQHRCQQLETGLRVSPSQSVGRRQRFRTASLRISRPFAETSVFEEVDRVIFRYASDKKLKLIDAEPVRAGDRERSCRHLRPVHVQKVRRKKGGPLSDQSQSAQVKTVCRFGWVSSVIFFTLVISSSFTGRTMINVYASDKVTKSYSRLGRRRVRAGPRFAGAEVISVGSSVRR